MNRKERDAIQRLMAMLAAGVDLKQALWDASNHGTTVDMARLQELWDELRQPT